MYRTERLAVSLSTLKYREQGDCESQLLKPSLIDISTLHGGLECRIYGFGFCVGLLLCRFLLAPVLAPALWLANMSDLGN